MEPRSEASCITNGFFDLRPREAMILLVGSIHNLLIPFTKIEEELRAFRRPLFLRDVYPPVRNIYHGHLLRTIQYEGNYVNYNSER